MQFSKPNLPKKSARLCVISGKNKKVIRALEQRGILCCQTRPSKSLSVPIADHPDMLMLPLKAGYCLVSADQKELLRRLDQFQIKAEPCKVLKPGYPAETAFNTLLIGNYLIGGSTSISFLSSFETKYEITTVKQGYTRCSVIPVTEQAAITADRGIADALKTVGIEVLLIRPETGILLKGYQYGFIGGCCGKISAHELAFCGDFKTLEQYREIEHFLERFDVEPISLTTEPMQDLGGILTLCEED